MKSDVGLLVSAVYVLITIWLRGTSAKDVFSEDEIRDIEKFAGDVMGCANIPGLALSVVRGDATFSTGLGVASMATGHTVDKRTIFNLGSASKAFVPYVLAEVMNGRENHDGRIKWNSTLKEILRHDRHAEVPMAWADTTLKDMLIYKSGSSAADMGTMVGLPQTATREELMRRLRFLPKDSEFRKTNHYSNIMYTIAGHLAERISGLSWTDLMKVKVFDKLFMNTSTFAPNGMTDEDSARPYRFHSSKPAETFLEQNISLFNLHPSEPVGSLMTSAEDVTKWLRHLVHNLKAKGNDSGINMLIADAFHLWAPVPTDHREGILTHDSEVAFGYGMGWYASIYRGQRRYKFSGSLYAYRTQIWLFPDSLSAIFVSINGPGLESAQRAHEGILYHISDTVLRKPPWMTTDLACCCHDTLGGIENDSTHRNISMPVEQMIQNIVAVEQYVGKFGNGLLGDLIIELTETGNLTVKLGRNLFGILTPGVTESKLTFSTTGPLENTEEWCSDKLFEFLSLTESEDSVHKKLYDKVRMYVNDNLFYEFQRNNLFETMLVLNEEHDRKQQDEAKDFIYSKRPTKYKNHVFGESNGSENVNNEAHKQQSNDNLQNNNDNSHLKSYSNELESKGRTNSEGHQSHQPYIMDNEEDDLGLDEVNDPKKSPVHGSEVHHKNDSKPGNTSSGFRNVTVLVFVLIIFTTVLK